MPSRPAPPDLLPRLLAPQLARAVATMPVVVVTGARQTGKSTLVRGLATAPTYAYQTLETPAVEGLARADPANFLTQAPGLVIDEVQRLPELLRAIKTAVDDDHPRRPGRFILTGSANLLLMRRVNESLAGRAIYLTLHPLTRREQLGLGSAGRWSDLLRTPVMGWRELLLDDPAPFEDWHNLARRGGYPPAAYELHDDAARRLWFTGYIQTYLQRDVPEISAIENVPDFDRVLRSIAFRVGTLVNQTALARDAGLPQSTVQRYVNILETSYQVVRVPAFAVSRAKQLVKGPKYYWSDTGLALALGGNEAPTGAHLENLILEDLLAWRDTHDPPAEICHWRTSKAYEVDFVIRDRSALLPIEVKATTQPSTSDIASLRVFMEEYSDRVTGALLLYGGDQVFWIADRVLAVPWWRVV